jgi:SAM-dependent methyltransferase
MPFETLEFPDGFFDLAFGDAILHHIDLDRSGAELARVLRPGGRASFIEPLGTNPVLGFARRRLPYPGKGRTEDERPIVYHDVRVFTHNFAAFSFREFGLISMVSGRFVRSRSLKTRLSAIDDVILDRARWMRPLCQQIWVGVTTSTEEQKQP